MQSEELLSRGQEQLIRAVRGATQQRSGATQQQSGELLSGKGAPQVRALAVRLVRGAPAGSATARGASVGSSAAKRSEERSVASATGSACRRW